MDQIFSDLLESPGFLTPKILAFKSRSSTAAARQYALENPDKSFHAYLFSYYVASPASAALEEHFVIAAAPAEAQEATKGAGYVGESLSLVAVFSVRRYTSSPDIGALLSALQSYNASLDLSSVEYALVRETERECSQSRAVFQSNVSSRNRHLNLDASIIGKYRRYLLSLDEEDEPDLPAKAEPQGEPELKAPAGCVSDEPALLAIDDTPPLAPADDVGNYDKVYETVKAVDGNGAIVSKHIERLAPRQPHEAGGPAAKKGTPSGSSSTKAKKGSNYDIMSLLGRK